MDEALKKCWRYLNRKMYTVRELSDQLRRDGFDGKTIEETIAFLQEKGYLNDAEYIQAYLESRKRRPKGYLAIVDELKRKGVASSYLVSLRDDFYPLEEEVEDALRLLQAGKERGEDEEKMKTKLLRRGFTWEAIERALSRMRDSRYS
ncbi:MAG: regulatory protein RecX, partial [Candidatus Caldatribacteriaceae bacterium]